MNDYGEVIAPDAMRFERLLPGPIERVWSYLVESEKRARWLCGGETVLEVGGNVDLHFHNAGLSSKPDIPPPEKHKDMPERLSFSGTVTACDPPRLLSHTWDFEGEHSEVTYELSEEGDKVKLVLTHRRIDKREDMLSIFGGWHTHLEILADVMGGKEPQPFWKRHTKWEAEYEKRLAASN
jgi:uncharacterized protein YndB with AHSA1/START domain